MTRAEPIAEHVADLLAQRRVRVVFAESCTAGLISALLAQVPGVSASLCGSAVTYREATKESWLGISRSLLEDCTAVSESVSRAMALAVLDKTPEADYSLSITGYLGPDAPPDQDGRVFIAVARRSGPKTELVRAHEYQLTQKKRVARQHQAAVRALQTLRDALEHRGDAVDAE